MISVWIFQVDPTRYDILGALEDEEVDNTIHWRVNQHWPEIRDGHIGIIWISGDNAGIYAVGNIRGNPRRMEETGAERKYWIPPAEEPEILSRVELYVTQVLKERPISKEKLKDQGLKNLSILKQPQGTNFPVTDEEWRIISELINNNIKK